MLELWRVESGSNLEETNHIYQIMEIQSYNRPTRDRRCAVGLLGTHPPASKRQVSVTAGENGR